MVSEKSAVNLASNLVDTALKGIGDGSGSDSKQLVVEDQQGEGCKASGNISPDTRTRIDACFGVEALGSACAQAGDMTINNVEEGVSVLVDKDNVSEGLEVGGLVDSLEVVEAVKVPVQEVGKGIHTKSKDRVRSKNHSVVSSKSMVNLVDESSGDWLNDRGHYSEGSCREGGRLSSKEDFIMESAPLIMKLSGKFWDAPDKLDGNVEEEGEVSEVKRKDKVVSESNNGEKYKVTQEKRFTRSSIVKPARKDRKTSR